MFTETWYSEECDVIDLENYRTFYLNRSCKRGCGVSFHIKCGIKCEILEQFSVITRYNDISNINLTTLYARFAICVKTKDRVSCVE